MLNIKNLFMVEKMLVTTDEEWHLVPHCFDDRCNNRSIRFSCGL